MSKDNVAEMPTPPNEVSELKTLINKIYETTLEASDCMNGVALVTENHNLATRYVSAVFPDILVREARQALSRQLEMFSKLDDLVKRLEALEARA